MIDSTIVRAHQHSAGAKKRSGRSRGGLSTKIHATVDALGNPTGLHLVGGQVCDLDGADALLPDVSAIPSWRIKGMTPTYGYWNY